ncbi:MAG: HAD family phosphatase, partial [Candidatus Puniceispirillaceae bacterium]
LAVELLAVSATSCMVLEDSNNGVAAALASQIRTIHLPDTQIPARAFAENPQYLHADTLAMAERLIFQAE